MQDETPDPPDPPSTIAPELRSAWRFSIIQQVLVYVGVFYLARDNRFIYAAVIAHVIYWAGLGFIIFLRRSKPLHLDLLFARWSFPLLWLIIMLILMRIAQHRMYL